MNHRPQHCSAAVALTPPNRLHLLQTVSVVLLTRQDVVLVGVRETQNEQATPPASGNRNHLSSFCLCRCCNGNGRSVVFAGFPHQGLQGHPSCKSPLKLSDYFLHTFFFAPSALDSRSSQRVLCGLRDIPTRLPSTNSTGTLAFRVLVHRCRPAIRQRPSEPRQAMHMASRPLNSQPPEQG